MIDSSQIRKDLLTPIFDYTVNSVVVAGYEHSYTLKQRYTEHQLLEHFRIALIMTSYLTLWVAPCRS